MGVVGLARTGAKGIGVGSGQVRGVVEFGMAICAFWTLVSTVPESHVCSSTKMRPLKPVAKLRGDRSEGVGVGHLSGSVVTLALHP